MPVQAKSGLSLYAIWRYSRRNKAWTHVGYSYSESDAKTVAAAYNTTVGTTYNYYSYTRSTYKSPSKWSNQWVAVFYKYGTSEWGRFLDPYNIEIYQSLREYFEDWEEKNRVPAATTKDVYLLADLSPTYSQSSTMDSSMNCAGSGRYAYLSSSGVRCV